MAQHNTLGQQGEAAAAGYLIKKGYTIIQQNWRSGRYEIDIIASKGDELVIVEVKTRTGQMYEAPEKAVDWKKIRHLVSAADHYLKMTSTSLSVRFDIISIVVEHGGMSIEHIEDAFYPPLG